MKKLLIVGLLLGATMSMQPMSMFELSPLSVPSKHDLKNANNNTTNLEDSTRGYFSQLRKSITDYFDGNNQALKERHAAILQLQQAEQNLERLKLQQQQDEELKKAQQKQKPLQQNSENKIAQAQAQIDPLVAAALKAYKDKVTKANARRSNEQTEIDKLEAKLENLKCIRDGNYNNYITDATFDLEININNAVVNALGKPSWAEIIASMFGYQRHVAKIPKFCAKAQISNDGIHYSSIPRIQQVNSDSLLSRIWNVQMPTVSISMPHSEILPSAVQDTVDQEVIFGGWD